MSSKLYAQRMAAWLPHGENDDHKYDFGHVLILAGSQGFYGAAVHAGLAALRVGAGLASLGIEASLSSQVGLWQPDLMSWSMPPREQGWSLDELKQLIEQRHINTLLIGPGLGQTAAALPVMGETLHYLSQQPLHVVLDADALVALKLWKHKVKGHWVITPHAGEAQRLFGPGEFKRSAISDWVHQTGIICVYKDPRITLFNENGDTQENPTGNLALAKAGTGDVLAGMIAGLLAQGCSAFQAAALASYMHGRAADLWVAAHGAPRSLLASDLLILLPQVLEELSQHA